MTQTLKAKMKRRIKMVSHLEKIKTRKRKLTKIKKIKKAWKFRKKKKKNSFGQIWAKRLVDTQK